MVMAGDVLQSRDSSLSVAKYVAALAPVLLVAIGYMDPGNWACAIEGGSRFGFELLWVVVVSNVMAALFQTLATRLGLVSAKLRILGETNRHIYH
jgi:manganese transport protein